MGSRRADFAADLARRRTDAGLSLADVAVTAHVSRGYVHHVEHGHRWPSRPVVTALDAALDAGGCLLDRWADVDAEPPAVITAAPGDVAELEAVELARRAAASDLSDRTLAQLETAVDDIAIAYPSADPAELLPRVRAHLAYVGRLLDARGTLDERRRLLVVAGWLSLLVATLYIDLEQQRPARGWLSTTEDLARQTGHTEQHAWRYETEAWAVLTRGNYPRAVELSQTAQRTAPRGSSAAIQATAQEGRLWARLGQPRDTFSAVNRVQSYTGSMAPPDRPEHHYRYDPNKALAYTATTLAWLGDTAAERYARETVARLQGNGDSRWPRRLATANLDLALALLASDQLDEAAARALAAIGSGKVVPSNYWRAAEVVRAVEARDLPEADDLREAFEAMRRDG